MKKYWLLIGLLVASWVISACGVDATSTNPESGEGSTSVGTADSSTLSENGFEMPLSLKLALGTFKLDGSSNEIGAEEAAALLPLWKAVRSLGSSDTVAADEINALYVQIQETMTPDQIAAIDQMQLSQASMTEIADKIGIELSAGNGQFGNRTPEQQATAQAARESGVLPQGSFPGGDPGGGGGPGGEFQGGGNLSPELQATMTARRSANGSRISIGVPTAIMDALIQYLEGKSG